MKKTIYNPALKETITFSKTANETQGAYSELEISLQAGGGNPMHYHKSYSELFTAVDGILGLELRNKKYLYLNPGESYLVKRGQWHRFFNPTDTNITFTNRVEPASPGLENTLRILCGLASDDLYNSRNIPKNIYHMAICGDISDMRLTGLAGAITTPLIKLIAYLGRKKGIEKQLVRKYCV